MYNVTNYNNLGMGFLEYCYRLVERRNICTIIFAQIEPVRFYFTKVAGVCPY